MRKSLCRACRTPLNLTFIDLGVSPLANAYVDPAAVDEKECYYPLHARVCENCFLVQLDQFETPDRIFSEYAYFSSYSSTWLKHARSYVERVMARCSLGAHSLVVEIASNDGYLLQYFKEQGIPVLGIEPAANVMKIASQRSIPTLCRFFGRELAKELTAESHQADLLVGNNVLAHVPDLDDFVEGMKLLLRPHGIITLEFPHLMQLIARSQFDTIYHEHFSYFWLFTVESFFRSKQLRVFDVDELQTHGGSLRVYCCHDDDSSIPTSERVQQLLLKEEEAGARRPETYLSFTEMAWEIKRNLLEFLICAKRRHKRIIGYGAAAKGNTLLNFVGIRTDFLDFVADRSPHKQGKLLPGSRIPIVSPESIDQTRPDYILILPWNLQDEIITQLSHARQWGCQFVVAVPQLQVIS